jgi:hypothetical protein
MGSIATIDTVLNNENEFSNIKDAAIRTLGNNILTELCKHYPAYEGCWHITIDARSTGGVVKITNMAFSGRMGFTIPIEKIDGDYKNVMRLGGELLERYGVLRDKAVNLRDEMGKLKIDWCGEAIAHHG